jgi:hypothetical protein
MTTTFREEGNTMEDLKQIQPVPGFSRAIVLERHRYDGSSIVNIEQRIKYHSPTGFEWGYGGSGPADLALNILSYFVPVDEAFRLHQSFKWDFISPLPHEGGTIKNEAILAWIKSKEGEV